jgi:hypothetical protein
MRMLASGEGSDMFKGSSCIDQVRVPSQSAYTGIEHTKENAAYDTYLLQLCNGTTT